MTQAEASEFPFVDALPKRERSKLLSFIDRCRELSKITDEKGMLIPIVLAAKVLGVTRPRVDQLIEAGRLEAYDVDGHSFVTQSSVFAYAKTERKAGRPPKTLAMVEADGVVKTTLKLGREIFEGK